MKIRTVLLAAAAGAAIAYFMDSERGAARRAAAKERAESLKAQAMPKIQELRRQADDAMEPELSYAGNGSGTGSM